MDHLTLILYVDFQTIVFRIPTSSKCIHLLNSLSVNVSLVPRMNMHSLSCLSRYFIASTQLIAGINVSTASHNNCLSVQQTTTTGERSCNWCMQLTMQCNYCKSTSNHIIVGMNGIMAIVSKIVIGLLNHLPVEKKLN